MGLVVGPLWLLWLVAAAGCRGRLFERAAVREAAEYGLRKMNELVLETEPRLYKMGMRLSRDEPASYVAAFNDQGERARRLARFGYAALQASSRLAQQVYEGRGPAPARFPPVSPLDTRLHEQCPEAMEGPVVDCHASGRRYRLPDGRCNNPAHPRRGAAVSRARRFLPPLYRDGLERVRDSVSGGALPSARAVSSAIHGDRDVQLAGVSHMVMQWGQFLDHDLTATAQSRGFNGSVPKCCGDGGRSFQPPELTHPDCLAIAVPPGDGFYGRHGVRCLEFVRSSPAPRAGCALGPREQINQVTSYLDGSVVYGSDERRARRLRLGRDGLLRYSRVQYRLPLLPASPPPQGLCRGRRCVEAGDGRANEQPGLTAVHTLWLRAHNRLATELAHLNPRWDDDRLYQEARRLVGAMLQHVTFGEFLPVVLGEDVMKRFDLQLRRSGRYDGYDIRADATIANAFSAAAFRFGHSLVERSLARGDRNHQQLSSNVSLHEEMADPASLRNIGAVDRLLLGLCAQPSQRRDEFITEQLTNHLFQGPGRAYGADLAAINIQRGRDHGLPPYGAWRRLCGLRRLSGWGDLAGLVSADTLRRLRGVYRDVDDIDLFPGGMAERPVTGGLVGPTFACIIAQQFSNLRRGDRFWYENGEFESSFTPAQLQQLRRVTLARIMCDNLDSIDTIQPFVFLMADHDRNPHVSCKLIPQFDLKPWVEHHKESHPHYPGDETYNGAGLPSARPENEAEELPSYPSETGGSQHKPQAEQVLPSFLIDEDPFDEENSASASESVVPAFLVDTDKLETSQSPDHHYVTASVKPSYLIDDKFQQSKPTDHHYTSDDPRPSQSSYDKYKPSRPTHLYTTQSVKPSYLVEDKYQSKPHHHYTTEKTKPSYLIDDKFQHSYKPNHQYTTESPNTPSRPSIIVIEDQHYNKPNHQYTNESPNTPSRPSIIVIEDQHYNKPNHQYTTESPNAHSRPSIIIIEDYQHNHNPNNPYNTQSHNTSIEEEYIKPPRPFGSKPTIEVITTRPQNSFSETHFPGSSNPDDHYAGYRPSDSEDPIYIIIPGKEPGSQTSGYHEHSRPDKYHSTGPSAFDRPAHMYEEYLLPGSDEHRVSSQRPGHPQTFAHSSGYKSTSRPYSFIERYNEPVYYYNGDRREQQASSYLKYVGLWLPEELDPETSTSLGDEASQGSDGSGDGIPTVGRDDEWSFVEDDVEDDSKLPEMPRIAADPLALFEIPNPIALFDEEELGSGDDSRSLA
ncbi:lactoperoxidase-like [Bacillus rossius redtenbacheri]|uniref:lactoperoxidase-like n=1 Tax=Bacillus rossius redtenbacheri TaxID=93214 RepID=UPI002FDE3316